MEQDSTFVRVQVQRSSLPTIPQHRHHHRHHPCFQPPPSPTVPPPPLPASEGGRGRPPDFVNFAAASATAAVMVTVCVRARSRLCVWVCGGGGVRKEVAARVRRRGGIRRGHGRTPPVPRVPPPQVAASRQTWRWLWWLCGEGSGLRSGRQQRR